MVTGKAVILLLGLVIILLVVVVAVLLIAHLPQVQEVQVVVGQAGETITREQQVLQIQVVVVVAQAVVMARLMLQAAQAAPVS